MRVTGEIVFPNNIKDFRTRRQLTQAQLGRLMDPPLSESTISKMESGERRLTNLQLANLATILDCRPEEIPVVSGRDAPIGVQRWQQVQQDAVRYSVESGAAASGYVLAQLRKKYGKTMQQVADAIGMTLSVYHRVEMASRIIQEGEIAAVARLYRITPDRLIGMIERKTRENREQLERGVAPEELLPRTPRSLLKDDPKWGRLGALERYAMRRSIRYARPPAAAATLPVYGSVATAADGSRRFEIDRGAAVDTLSVAELLRPSGDGFLVRNFSQRLGFVMRSGALAYVEPRASVAMGDLCFVQWRDGGADAALVIGDGIGPLKLKMYNPEEDVATDDPRVAGILRIAMLIMP